MKAVQDEGAVLGWAQVALQKAYSGQPAVTCQLLKLAADIVEAHVSYLQVRKIRDPNSCDLDGCAAAIAMGVAGLWPRRVMPCW